MIALLSTRMLARPLALVLLPALLYACSQAESDGGPELSMAPPVPVRTAAVELRSSDEVLRFAGVARTRQRAALTFQVGGVIAERHVEMGQPVAAGQVLAQLYNPRLVPARDAARARLEQLLSDERQAVRELRRMEELHGRAMLPAQDVEQQRSRIEGMVSAIANAQAALDQSEQILQEGSLRAPFAGRIEAILLEPGEFVQAGQPVMRIAADNGLEVEILAPAQMLDGLLPGETVPVWTSLNGRQLKGTISEIASSSSGNRALYPVIVRLPEEALRAGDALEVGIRRQRQPELALPMHAVMRSAEGLAVFRMDGNRAQRVAITVRQMQGDYVVLEPGTLNAGDAVVYAGLSRLADGDTVEVLK